MKQTLTLISCLFAAVSFAACKGNATAGTSGEGGDSTQTIAPSDSTITEEEGEVDELPIDENSLPYAFVYYEGSGLGKVLYWSEVERKHDVDPDKEQMLIRQHKTEYNAAINDDNIFDVTYKEEVLPRDNEEDWTKGVTIGMIGATIEEAGLVYRFAKPQAVKRALGDWDEGFFVLTSKAHLDEHPLVHFEYVEGTNDDYRPLPANVIKQMEQKYGLKSTRSALVASIGEDITYGVMQFEPKGEHVLALEVLIQKGNVYVAESQGYYDAGTGEFGWNVDDEGEYYASSIIAVVENGDFPLIFTTRGAPESLTTGWMTVKDGKIVRHTQEMYYIYYN
ncbi:MAG: hypothetical protein K5778_07365 [Bacteroidaceae bacterium]|nr:hypothetical protein [Bacteroidaceae bacterium]